jgi:hypothetical protein
MRSDRNFRRKAAIVETTGAQALPREKTSADTFAVSALTGAALGILFTALFVASRQGAVHDLVQRPDAVVPLLCLMLNMCALLAGALLATSFASSERDDARPTRRPDERPPGLPVAASAVAIRRCAGGE